MIMNGHGTHTNAKNVLKMATASKCRCFPTDDDDDDDWKKRRPIESNDDNNKIDDKNNVIYDGI